MNIKANFLKRPFDIVLSFAGIVVSIPLWILIALLIWLEDRGPVFYLQERVGKEGRLFKALKFRSMVKNAEEEPVQAAANDPRITKTGKVLRASALDELPQLINILKGDMSFVGPRALRPEEKEVDSGSDVRELSEIPGYYERHAVRPGLTGLTQVYLPTYSPRRRKFRYDLLYINKHSFCLDIKLILLSFWISLRGKWESKQKKV
jgi:lipopolysaccharide/colanic/teichoic acid biosynthesis glycosyltransferase